MVADETRMDATVVGSRARPRGQGSGPTPPRQDCPPLMLTMAFQTYGRHVPNCAGSNHWPNKAAVLPNRAQAEQFRPKREAAVAIMENAS